MTEQETLDRVMRDGTKKTDDLEREVRTLKAKLVAGGNLYVIERERAENATKVLRWLVRWYDSNHISDIPTKRGSGELDDIIDYARRVSQ